MTGIFVAFIQVVACLGFGAAGLRLLGYGAEKNSDEGLLYAFVLGMGFVGWCIFFIGIIGFLNTLVISIFLSSGLMAAVLFWSDLKTEFSKPRNLLGLIGASFLILVICLDFFEGLTPPGDADTLAYHFALPKQFLRDEKIEFVPRAFDGAITLLVQMTYVPALALGGEQGVMFWVFLSGLGAIYAVYVLALRHLSKDWSLIVALIFATTPAVIYGGGSGQVETRNVLFVIAAVLALTNVQKSGNISYICLVGIFSGFFAGGKYFGLLFVGICGLIIFLRTLQIRGLLTFSVGALATGFQWYIWNAVHIGDPVFPMLYEWLGTYGTTLWSNEHQNYLRKVYLPAFKQVPSDLFWLLFFPFKATLMGEQAFSSGRTGLGPIVLLLLPFAIMSTWTHRDCLFKGRLFTYITIVLIFYIVWFFSASPQRVRFLLPIYPLLLVAIFAAAIRTFKKPMLFSPAIFAISFTVLVQFFGQTLYTLKAIKYVFGEMTRKEFLIQSSEGLEPIFWINANLKNKSKVLLTLRHYFYYLEVPYFYAHPIQQAQINLLPSAQNVSVFVQQIQKLDITHLLVPDIRKDSSSVMGRFGKDVLKSGCFEPIRRFPIRSVASRTFPEMGGNPTTLVLYKFLGEVCP